MEVNQLNRACLAALALLSTARPVTADIPIADQKVRVHVVQGDLGDIEAAKKVATELNSMAKEL